MSIERLQLHRAAARTLRYHNVPPLEPNTVGQHTFGMLGILRHIYPVAPLQLMWAIIEHDVPEGVTGDIPSPMLHKYDVLRNGDSIAAMDVIDKYVLEDPAHLPAFEYKVYKYCDRMELAIFSLEEADSGNIKMLRPYKACMRSIERSGLTDVTPEALQLYDYVRSYFERWHSTPDLDERLDLMFHGTPNK